MPQRMERFTHPPSRLIWYGSDLADINSDLVLTYPMDMEELKISTGSHMSPLFSPANPYYRESGEMIICENGFSSSDKEACEQGAQIWFSAWGYTERGKIYARLTWNPYFSELEDAMDEIVR